MKISKLKIANITQDQLISYLAASVLFDYTDISDENSILATEEFNLLTGSNQLNLIIIKSIDYFLQIDIISGGKETGVFSFVMGSEEAFINKIQKLLKDFCKDFGESVETVV